MAKVSAKAQQVSGPGQKGIGLDTEHISVSIPEWR
jgi:hypothetical protein